MREVVFRVLADRAGQLEAQAESLPIQISAPSLEELQHEAREALIEHLGQAHGAYRVRIRRYPGQPVSPSSGRRAPSPAQLPAASGASGQIRSAALRASLSTCSSTCGEARSSSTQAPR